MFWKKRDKYLKSIFDDVNRYFKLYISLLKKYDKYGQKAQFSELPKQLEEVELNFLKSRLKLEQYLLNKNITNPMVYQTFNEEYVSYPSAKEVLGNGNKHK